MAESSRLWTTNGTGDGTATGYTATDWETIFRYCFNGGNESAGGVLVGIGNELAISGSTSPLSLASGAAIVYGHLYINDAPLSLAVTKPLVGTTGGRVVLRVNWAAQTVRAFVVRNTDGIAAIPALTQSAGSTWEISLLSFTINTGGAITYTEGQEKITYSTRLDKSRVAGFSTGQVPYGSTTGVLTSSDNMTFDPTSKQLLLNPAATNPPIIVGSNGIAQLIAGLAADPIPTFGMLRQGQIGDDWNTGITAPANYTPSNIRVQFGMITTSFTNGVATITFPTPFKTGAKPWVMLATKTFAVSVGYQASPTNTSLSVATYQSGTANIAPGTDVLWLALGPRS